MNDRRTLKSGLPTALSEELSELAGALIPAANGRYRLERILGRGALYVTFRATRISESGAVPHAVKVLRPSLLRAWPSGARVLSREQQRVLTILNERVPPSPHVLRLLEVGQLTDGAHGLEGRVPFLAQELIEPAHASSRGGSLFLRVRDAVANTGVALDPASAESILRGVALGLDWVHQHGLLHRGLSPNNVLVSGLHEVIAKVADVAISRPEGLPASFGVDLGTAFALGDSPYRAPELDALRAQSLGLSRALTPACDVFALGALARFVLTGLGPVEGNPPLHEVATLHPGARGDALKDFDAAIAHCTASDPEQRPPTAHSAWWNELAPPLRALAAASERTFARRAPRAAGTATHASGPSSWVWTERHRPETPHALAAIATDAGGHAMALERAGQLVFFDGSLWRPPPVSNLHAIEGVVRLAPGTFVAFGRGPAGARASRLDAEGWLPLLDRSERAASFVAALAHEGMLHLIEKRENALRLVSGSHALLLEGAQQIHALAPLDDHAILLVGEAPGGAPYLATFDARTALLRPQPAPAAGPLRVAAGAFGEAWIGGPHGTLILVRRVRESIARLFCAREQLPTHEDVTALAVAPDGTAWCATGAQLHRRDLDGQGAATWKSVFHEPSAGRLVAIAPGSAGVVAFSDTGVVIEGRALGG